MWFENHPDECVKKNFATAPSAKLYWGKIVSLAVFSIAAGVALIHFYPAYRDLTLFGMYSIPSQFLISPFPHEPALLQAAKHFPAWEIAIAGTIGCCIAGFLDYWIIAPLINHRRIRPKLDNTRLFRKSLHYFFKYPFLILVFAAISPVPFYPFKFLSVAGHYPQWKYQSALVVGRTPRYYILALLGHALQIPTWVLITLFIVIVISPFIKKIIDLLRKKPAVETQIPDENGSDDVENLPEFDNWTHPQDSPNQPK